MRTEDDEEAWEDVSLVPESNWTLRDRERETGWLRTRRRLLFFSAVI